MTDFYTIAKGGSTDYSVIYPAGTDEDDDGKSSRHLSPIYGKKQAPKSNFNPDYTEQQTKKKSFWG